MGSKSTRTGNPEKPAYQQHVSDSWEKRRYNANVTVTVMFPSDHIFQAGRQSSVLIDMTVEYRIETDNQGDARHRVRLCLHEKSG